MLVNRGQEGRDEGKEEGRRQSRKRAAWGNQHVEGAQEKAISTGSLVLPIRFTKEETEVQRGWNPSQCQTRGLSDWSTWGEN